MFESIMVPLDGSSLAERALDLAVPIAQSTGAELHLAKVRRVIPAPESGRADVERLYLERAAGLVDHRLGRPITTALLVDRIAGIPLGDPPRRAVADVLEDYVRENHIGLTIMTTHGRGGLSRFYIGSVADAFMRYSPSPVLMFKPAGKRPAITHILVLLDGSEEAQSIIPSALALAKATSARCTLLRIIAPGSDPYDAARALTESSVVFCEAGISVSVAVRMSDNVAATILLCTMTYEVDAVALTTRTRTPMQRFLLGSVADKLLRQAEMPVLISNPFGQVIPAGGVAGAEEAHGR